MKLLQFARGGRPFANNDILGLQTEVYDAVEATLVGAPAMVLSGCKVEVLAGGKVGNIGAGFLWLAGEILRYAGANNVALPAEVVAGPAVEDDIRAYQTGGSKACMSELSLVTQAAGTAPTGTERVQFLSAPTRTYAKWVESQCRQLGDLQDSVLSTEGLCDKTGLGYPDGPRAGWGLANGQGGRANLMEKFRIGLNPENADYASVGKTGGAAKITLSIEQMPKHNHTNGNFQYLSQVGKNTSDGDLDDSASEPNLLTVGKMQDAGGGQPFDNRPPYYTVAVWQWVGLS
jgi:hypothetical protein